MSALASLYPQPLWQWFAQICAIPHPSKHEQALSHHIQAWARDKGLELVEDKVGNLIIKKPATPGMENRKTVVIQAHLDMVPQKNADKVHDFNTDPIEPSCTFLAVPKSKALNLIAIDDFFLPLLPS